MTNPFTSPTKKSNKIESTCAPKKINNTKYQKNSKTVTNTNKNNKYRGKGKKHKDTKFTILLTNLRGYKSKEHSFKKIVKKVKPSMILMNETQMLGKMKVSLKPYTSWTRNRTDKSGGGVATSVSQHFGESAVGAGEGENNEEYIVTRLGAFKPALNVVNSYGEQRKTKKEEVEEK